MFAGYTSGKFLKKKVQDDVSQAETARQEANENNSQNPTPDPEPEPEPDPDPELDPYEDMVAKK